MKGELQNAGQMKARLEENNREFPSPGEAARETVALSPAHLQAPRLSILVSLHLILPEQDKPAQIAGTPLDVLVPTHEIEAKAAARSR
jgi:hypothetical protein